MTRQFSGWRVRDAAFENFQFSRRRGGYNRRASSDTMASGASSEATSLCTPPRRMRQAEYRFRSTAIASTPSIGAPHLHSWINEQTEHTITTFDGDNVFFFQNVDKTLCVQVENDKCDIPLQMSEGALRHHVNGPVTHAASRNGQTS